MAKPRSDLILASASQVRARLLRDAGLGFRAVPADIDESVIKQASRSAGETGAECALKLAADKARAISRRQPGVLVVGADQILDFGDRWLDKPADMAAAREHLLALRGHTHELATAVVAVRDGEILWHAISSPRLTMREFSPAFLDGYIAAEGDVLLGSVGAYRLEARGAQLFEKIEGDYFAVLGLPLIDLLEFLRRDGMLER
jgi:septum formation protein